MLSSSWAISREPWILRPSILIAGTAEAGARLLYLFAPGGFEELIRAMSEPAEELAPPPADLATPENVVELAAGFGVELLL